MKKLTIALAFLILATSFAQAARDDDFDFAQGLVDRRFYDLAKEQFNRIVSEARGSEQKANGELGLALLLKAQANDIQNEVKRTPEEVLAVFADAEKRFDAFLSTYSNHPKRTDAKFEVGNLLRMKGTYLNRLMGKFPDRADEYRGQADKAFGTAVDLFRDVAMALKAADRPEDDWYYRKARYFEAVTHYEKAVLYPERSSERRGLLEKTMSLLDDFVWENEENLLGGYAYMYYGLAKSKLGETEEALNLLSTAATNYGVPDRNSPGQDYVLWTDLFMQAYWQIGQYANEIGPQNGTDPREFAIAQFGHMMERVPDVYTRKTGHFALLEYARCLLGLEQYDAAIAIVSRVSTEGEKLSTSTDWGAATAWLANKLLNEIIGEMSVKGVRSNQPPGILMKAALGKMTSRDWDAAVLAFQDVVTRTAGTPDEGEYGPTSWMDIGECYYRKEKFLEAMYAYDHVVAKWPALPVAGDAAYYSYRAATALHAATKDPRDEELKKQKRGDFAAKFKTHPRSIDLQYYEGADFIADADAARLAGNVDAAKPLYDKAIEQLAGVKATSILYSKAMARTGEVLFQLNENEKALEQFAKVKKYIEDPKNVTTDEERALNRKQALAISAYYASRCLARLERWTDVVATLKNYETTFAEEKNFHSPVKFERVRAFVSLKQLGDAENQALDLREADADNPLTPFAFSITARAFQEAATTAKDAGDETAWRTNLTKAAEYFAYYMDRKDRPAWDEWQTIALWYRDLADWEKSEVYLEKALELLTALLDTLPAADPAKDGLSKSQDYLVQMLTEVLVKQEKWPKARDYFERLLIQDPNARDRVFQLLEAQAFSEAELKELLAKIRAVPSLMEGLAQAYIKIGGEARPVLRAITLLKVLKLAMSRGQNQDMAQYGKIWWRWSLLQCVAYITYGQDNKDAAAFDNAIKLIDDWDNLGVLKNAPNYQDFLKLRQQAEVERRKLGR